MFKLLLALLFCLNLSFVAQADAEERQLVQMSRHLLQSNATASPGTGDDDDDGTDDDGADDDGTDDDGTDDDGDDDDGSNSDVDTNDTDTDNDDTNDTDTDADDTDNDADDDTDDDTDDDDADSTDTDASGSDSDDDGDTDSSADADSDSDDSDSDSDDSGDSDSSEDSNADTNADTNGGDSGTNTFIDPCDGLTGAECTENYDADGNPICAQNVNTADCYSIVQSQGLYGSGNFDAGYKAAKAGNEGEAQSLNAVVAVLGAMVGVLVLMVGGGAYWLWRRTRKEMQYRHESIAMEVGGGRNGADALPMIEETV